MKSCLLLVCLILCYEFLCLASNMKQGPTARHPTVLGRVSRGGRTWSKKAAGLETKVWFKMRRGNVST